MIDALENLATDLNRDVRTGLRSLAKSPAFTLVAVLTLAIGIGSTSAIFSFVDGVLLRPLPYLHSERIVTLDERLPRGTPNGAVSTGNFLDWRDQSTVFERIAANKGIVMTLTGGEEPVPLNGARASAAYFDVFGIRPALGRTFTPDEDQPGKDHVVVLSHRLWSTRFGGDAGLIGQRITLDGEPYTVIGVMPDGSVFDRGWSQFWRPLTFKPNERSRDFHWIQVMARLKPGITLERARAEMDAIAGRIGDAYPATNRGWGVQVDRLADVMVGPQLERSLYVLLAAVGMLLLIGCANIANLVLARGSAREVEVAVRAALGASRSRLIRQFLTEHILLSAVGGGIGIPVGYAAMHALQRRIPPFTLPRDVHVEMDGRVIAFTLILSAATGIIFGLVPALSSTRVDLAGAMKEGGRGSSADGKRRRLRNGLVVAEIALAFVLLVGGGLLLRSFLAMMDMPLGFDGTNVLTLSLPIHSGRFSDSSALVQHVQRVVARVSAVPGVSRVAAADALPLEGWNNGMPFVIAGHPAADAANLPDTGYKAVLPDYFQVLGIQIVKGRGLTDRDTKGSPPVAVINTTFAKRYFAGEEPLGQRLLIEEIAVDSPQLGARIPWQIVGLIADERTSSLEGTQRPGVYVPLAQSPTPYISLVVRAKVEPELLTRAIAHAVSEVDPGQAITDVRTVDQIKSESTASSRLRTALLGVFASLALLLAAIGIYGVLSYAVAQRTREIGVRMALGASRRDVLGMVLTSGIKLTTAGLSCGIAGALVVTKLLGSLVIGIDPRDPVALAGSVLVLVAVAALACYAPARRATHLDPLVALHEE